jgi:hypothetical protein
MLPMPPPHTHILTHSPAPDWPLPAADYASAPHPTPPHPNLPHLRSELEKKPEAVKLVYSEDNKESYVPVKRTTPSENTAYMVELYERCQETRKKTHAELADKYLQPLIKARGAK